MPPTLKRASSSFFANLKRQKVSSGRSSPQKRARTESNGAPFERLQDVGPITSLPPSDVSQDVLSLIRHARDRIFEDIPERASGMNSVRTAEVLNYRKTLPPIVSLAHVYAMSLSPTQTDREIAGLVQAGTLRRTAIMGRGKGIAPLGEGLVLAEDWARIARMYAPESLAIKYTNAMSQSPTSTSIPASEFTTDEVSQLLTAGLMTFSSPLSTVFSRPGAASLGSVALAGSTAATGTIKATGGHQAVHDHGGGGGGLPVSRSVKNVGDLSFALPGTGGYLKLVTEARQHALDMLVKSSPKFKESTMNMLRERWNGGVLTDDPSAMAKKARNEFIGVLPGRTKKWKSFYGMSFDWVLEELLGSGQVECFNTGSVGLGVRATT